MTVLRPQTKTPYVRPTLAAAARPDLRPPAQVNVDDPYFRILATLPKPLTTGQMTAQANAQISPLVAALTNRIAAQTKAATGAIAGYSNDAAQKLAALDFGGVYQPSIESQAAVDAAIRNSLNNAGSQDADQLAQRLAVLNDPSVAAAAGAVQANGAANGNTQLAQGSAALSNLLANSAAAKELGAKLPGIQRAQGLQNIAAATQTGQQALATGVEQLQGQLPSILQSLRSESDQRAQARAAALQNRLARQDALDATQSKNDTAITTAKIKAKTAQEAADAKRAQQDRTYRLQFSKTYGYDPITGKTIPGYKRDANGNVVKVAAAKPATKKGSKLTAKQVQDYKGTAATVAENSKNGFDTTDKNNVVTHHPPLTWSQAMDEMIKEGIPEPIARAALKRYYGDRDPATNAAIAGPSAPKRR